VYQKDLATDVQGHVHSSSGFKKLLVSLLVVRATLLLLLTAFLVTS
jgi:Annexin